PSGSTTSSAAGRSTSTPSGRLTRRHPPDLERLLLILPDVLVVLRQALREGVPAVVHRHEVEIIGARRLDGGPQRRRPRIADRPRRQAAVTIGVVEGIDLQVVVAQ